MIAHPINIDFRIQGDIKTFLEKSIEWLNKNIFKVNDKWINACKYWKTKYPMRNEGWEIDNSHVNMYNFIEKLSNKIDMNARVFTNLFRLKKVKGF